MSDCITLVDLFSGCGGLSLGFERQGFHSIAAYENWSPAAMTYGSNFPNAIHPTSLDSNVLLPKSTVVVGGPPCQGFSSAGLRRATDDRNTLVSDFARLVARHKPLAFVFENVEGFFTGARGQFVFDLLIPLIEAGYRIHVRKINAAHYGVPQHRKRAIAIGGLGWDPTFPEPTHSASGAPGAALANRAGLPITPTILEALDGLPSPATCNDSNKNDGFCHFYTPFNETDRERAKLLKPGQCMKDLPEDLWHKSYKRRAYRRVLDGTPTEKRGGAPSGLRRLSGNVPSKAITGGALSDFIHPTQDRPLTIRECARLQTFPDTFRFQGKTTEKIQMIGNAVPVRLAECIARSLIRDLKTARVTHGNGALLSFVPTLSKGMSPVLAEVVRSINEAFIHKTECEQISLCL